MNRLTIPRAQIDLGKARRDVDAGMRALNTLGVSPIYTIGKFKTVLICQTVRGV
jgi:hypothetical protein